MIRSLSRHTDFVEVRRKGVTVLKRPLRLTALVQPESDVSRMGYVIPRSVGNAVRRNRIRRQLREIVHQFDRDALLPRGSFVLAVGADEGLTYSDLQDRLLELVTSVRAQAVEVGVSR